MKLEKETRLKLAIGLSTIFVVVEVIGGYIANSIAIYSDAAHLLTDIAGFGIALIAVFASKSPGTKHMTFGLARAEVFGALASIASLWIITAFLLYEAYIRAVLWFQGRAEDVNGFFMFMVAIFGVLVNICLGMVFHEDHGGDFHPSHSSCGHDHSHDGSHGHSHEHGSSTKYSKVSDVDLEHGHEHSHSACSGHDHNHDHRGSKNVVSSVKSPLIVDDHSHSSHSYQSCDDSGHDHGHAHGSSSSLHLEHDHSTCGGHDHAAVSHDEGHGHDHNNGGHGHDEHEHAPHNLIEATLKEPTDVNIEAAYLHVLTDLIQSIGVAIAGLAIWLKPRWQIIDPLCTFIFAFVALRSTVPLLGRVFTILLEGTPSHVDWEHVMEEFKEIPGVEEVHDLHIWSISSKSTSLTVHIRAYNPQVVLKAAHKICTKMGIDHPTIQVQDAKDEDFCFSQGCGAHNPEMENSPKSTCVLSNHMEISKAGGGGSEKTKTKK